MKQQQRSIMEDIFLPIESKQPTHASKVQLAHRQTRAADHFQTLAEQQEAKRQWALQFNQLIETWDEPVIEALNHLAQLRWPPEYVLGLIPVSPYRLRDEQIDEAHLWWVERDIPPQDKYRCAAYHIRLILDEQGQPALTVQSGTRVYPISPLTVENLKATVAKAGQDPPLIIPRKMGKVKD